MRKGNRVRNGAAVLLALCSNAATQPARIWLEQVPIQNKTATRDAPSPVLEIKLVLEAGSAPVEVHSVDPVMPRLRDAGGKEIGLGDWRNVAGLAPPQPPPLPQPPLAPGKRHVVCSYTVLRRPDGRYHLMAPFGGADMPAGTYAISAALDLMPITREAWTAQYRIAANLPMHRPSGSKTARNPEQEAEKYATHWATVASFFTGRVVTPDLTFTLH